MSGQVALDRQSMHNKHTCDQNVHKPFLETYTSLWCLEHPFLDHDACNERANQRTKHGDQTTYQTEHFNHIPVILHMTIKS